MDRIILFVFRFVNVFVCICVILKADIPLVCVWVFWKF